MSISIDCTHDSKLNTPNTDRIHTGCFESAAKDCCEMEERAHLHSDLGERSAGKILEVVEWFLLET